MSVVTSSNLEGVIAHLSSKDEFSIDTETTGLRPFHGDRPFSIVIGTDEKEFYVPVECDNIPDLGDVLGRSELHKLWGAIQNARLLFLANAKFDMHHLKTLGLDLPESAAVHDVSVVGRLLHNQLPSYSLDAMGSHFLRRRKDDKVKAYIEEHELWDWEDIPDKAVRGKRMYFYKVPMQILVPYALQDARLTYDVAQEQIRLIRKWDESLPEGKSRLWPLYERETKVTRVCYEMEQNGVRIDRTLTEGLLALSKQKFSEASSRFAEETGTGYVASAKCIIPALQARGVDTSGLPKTDKGNVQFDASSLKSICDPVAQFVVECKEAKSDINFYAGFLWYVDSNDVIHSDYRQGGTVTGRFCVAKGTPIETVRDVSKLPKGVPIEDVKAGDLVYTYDDELQLTVKRVLWAGKTGTEKVIRLHWLGQGRKKRGHIDVTPDHYIRRVDGTYTKARDLKVMDRVLAMGRSKTLGYGRIHSRNTEYREHMLIYKSVYGEYEGHIHHKDHNKLNNCLENLECLSPQEHTSYHSRLHAPLRVEQNREIARRNWAEGKFRVRRGKEHAGYKSVTRFALLRDLARKKGKPTKTSLVSDYATQVKKLREADIDWVSVKKRYGGDGKYISKGRLKRALQEPYPNNQKVLAVGFYRFRDLCTQYGLKPWNHVITKIEEIGSPVDVYDIEVEDTHNFIASEICVHNSSSNPNTQNLSRPEEGDSIDSSSPRFCLVPESSEFCFLMMDYKQQEYRLMLEYAQQMDLIEAVKGGLDVHQATAELTGLTRTQSKTLNFALLYGAGSEKISKMMGLSAAQGSDLIATYFSKLPKVRELIDKVRYKAKHMGYILTWSGRVLRYPLRSQAYAAPNHLIQGGCADITREAMVQCHKFLSGMKSYLTLSIHDELVFNLHRSEISVVGELQSLMERAYPHHLLPMEVDISHSWKSLGDKVKGLPQA